MSRRGPREASPETPTSVHVVSPNSFRGWPTGTLPPEEQQAARLELARSAILLSNLEGSPDGPSALLELLLEGGARPRRLLFLPCCCAERNGRTEDYDLWRFCLFRASGGLEMRVDTPRDFPENSRTSGEPPETLAWTLWCPDALHIYSGPQTGPNQSQSSHEAPK